MKTSKRMLAVVLALVMSFGFVLSASAADYTYDDQDKISADFANAVARMKDLGIMYGSSTTDAPDVWSFRPQEKLTRAEVCKILFVLYTTGDNADNFKDMSGFTDVSSSAWFAGYVNWAKSKGVVSGSNAAGTAFSPSGNVKLVEACKMFLVAMGYDAGRENMVGDAWQGFTMSLALQSGLLDGLESISNTAELTREQLAQMCSNTLDANSVKYEDGVAYETSDSVLKKYFKFDEIPGLVIATTAGWLDGSEVDEASAAGKTTLSVVVGKDSSNNNITITVDIPQALGLEYLGRSVNVLVKATSTKDKDDMIKSYNISKVYSVSYDDKAFTATAGDLTVNAGKLEYDDDGTLYTSASVAAAGNDILFIGYNEAVDTAIAGLNDEDPVTIVYETKGKTISRVLVKNYLFSKLTTNSSGKFTAKAYEGSASNKFSTAAKADIVVGADLAAKDAVVLAYTINGNPALDKVTSLTGRYTVANTDNTKFTINGTAYGLSTITGHKSGDTKDLRGKEALYYIYNGNILAAVGDTTSSSDPYALVTLTNEYTEPTGSKSIYVTLLTEKNTKIEAKLTQINSKTSNILIGDVTADTIYTYSYNESKGTVTLKSISDLLDGTVSAINAGVSVRLESDDGPGSPPATVDKTRFIDDKGVYFFKKPAVVGPPAADAEYFVFIGSALPKFKVPLGVGATYDVTNILYDTDKTANDTVKLMLIETEPDASSSTVVARGFLYADPYIDEDPSDPDTLIVVLPLIVNGEAKNYVAYSPAGSEDDITSTNIVGYNAGTVLNIKSMDSKTVTLNGASCPVIKEYEAPSAELSLGTTGEHNYAGYVGSVRNNAVMLVSHNNAQQQLYTCASNFKAYLVDGDEIETLSLSDVTVFDDNTESGKWNAVASLDSDGNLTALFINADQGLWE